MGQISAVDRLPEALRNRLIDLIGNPGLTEAYIAEQINTEAGKPVISQSSVNRYAQFLKKTTGRKRGTKAASVEESLVKIAAALEKIAGFMEKRYKGPS
jgi:hypothetical protein